MRDMFRDVDKLLCKCKEQTHLVHFQWTFDRLWSEIHVESNFTHESQLLAISEHFNCMPPRNILILTTDLLIEKQTSFHFDVNGL